MIEPSTGASWPEYFEVWVGLIVLIFTVGTALHLSGLNPATHRRLVQFLSEAGPQNWAKKMAAKGYMSGNEVDAVKTLLNHNVCVAISIKAETHD